MTCKTCAYYEYHAYSGRRACRKHHGKSAESPACSDYIEDARAYRERIAEAEAEETESEKKPEPEPKKTCGDCEHYCPTCGMCHEQGEETCEDDEICDYFQQAR